MKHFILLFFTLLATLPLLAQTQPNILYIMADDHDADAISAYNTAFVATPNIDRLAREGMLFKNAFVGNSICGPARATLLTGQHSHKNGMIDNHRRFDGSQTTLPKLLKTKGYQSAIVGKWHLVSYPTGFDFWKILPGQGKYYNPEMIGMDGDTAEIHGYATDVITNQALDWLEASDRQKPFLLLLHHKAPHRNFFPKPEHLERTARLTFPEPPTLFADPQQHGKPWQEQKMSILHDLSLCTDLKIDPADCAQIPGLKIPENDAKGYHWLMSQIPEAERERLKAMYAERGKQLAQVWGNDSLLLKAKYQWYIQDFMACVASVDENVGRVLDYLDRNGLTENTVVIYTSDQGFYLGENGWYDKRWMYDVSMRAPLLVRWPGKIEAGSVAAPLVQNIDFAPTMLDLAGAKIPASMQGVSLKPLLLGQRKTLKRKELYYHYYEYPIDHHVPPHLGVRGERYKLIYFYTLDEWEFYDLKTDPAEQRNLIHSLPHQSAVIKMKKKLLRLREKYDDREPDTLRLRNF